MRSTSIVSLFSALIVGGVFIACATGGDNATGDDGTGGGTDTDSGITTGPSDYDAGPTNPYASSPDGGVDAAAIKAKDSGASGKDSGGGTVDSGSTSGTNTDCTGTQGMQLSLSYEKECENFFLSTLGMSNDCNPGGNDCSPLSDGTDMCCFQPNSNSKCDIYYGAPQCVPK